MRKTYITYLRSAVVATMIGVSAMVAISTQQPLFAEDTARLTPADCRQAPATGRMRFNPCANLDASRIEVRR